MSQPRSPHDQGSTALGGPEPRRRRGLWWLWLLAAVVLVVLLLVLLSRCGGDDDSRNTASNTAGTGSSNATTPSAPSSPSTPSTAAGSPGSGSASSTTVTSSSAGSTATGGSAPGGQTGTLTAGSTNLLPLSAAAPQGSLSSYDKTTATGKDVVVRSVPADEGFWVGTSRADRIWVQIVGSGESPYHVKKGDHVDLTGTVVPNGDEFPAKVGVSRREGAAQLTREMSHIQVAQDGVRLTTGS